MDLNFVKDQLETFETFGKAIGTFLQNPAKLLGGLYNYFDKNTYETDWAVTKGVFSSEK